MANFSSKNLTQDPEVSQNTEAQTSDSGDSYIFAESENISPQQFASEIQSPDSSYTYKSDWEVGDNKQVIQDDVWGDFIVNNDSSDNITNNIVSNTQKSSESQNITTPTTSRTPITNTSYLTFTPDDVYSKDLSNQIFTYKDRSKFLNNKSIKKKIFLHHTGGYGDPYSVGDTFKNGKNEKTKDWLHVATSYAIGGKYVGIHRTKDKYDGLILKIYDDDKYWSYHSECGQNHKTAIGIEICNLGGLYKKGNKYVNGKLQLKPVDDSDIYDMKSNLGKSFCGFDYFQSYSQKQMDSTLKLLQYLCSYYEIPVQNFKDWSDSDFWTWFNNDPDSKNPNKPGIYTHHQISTLGKYDVAPLPEVIQMLRKLGSTKEKLIAKK